MTLERHREMTLSTLAARPGLAAASTEAIDGLRRAGPFAPAKDRPTTAPRARNLTT
jgi:hypothetical protein